MSVIANKTATEIKQNHYFQIQLIQQKAEKDEMTENKEQYDRFK